MKPQTAKHVETPTRKTHGSRQSLSVTSFKLLLNSASQVSVIAEPLLKNVNKGFVAREVLKILY